MQTHKNLELIFANQVYWDGAEASVFCAKNNQINVHSDLATVRALAQTTNMAATRANWANVIFLALLLDPSDESESAFASASGASAILPLPFSNTVANQ